jgi:hypothetical protein
MSTIRLLLPMSMVTMLLPGEALGGLSAGPLPTAR